MACKNHVWAATNSKPVTPMTNLQIAFKDLLLHHDFGGHPGVKRAEIAISSRLAQGE
jgi:hypothetical protein